MLDKLQEKYGLTSFTLKMIGIVLMVADHTHEMFSYVGAPDWLNMLGRIVAPIFLFLAAEGFHYTHSRVGYLRNLLIGFWITNVMIMILQQALPNEHVVMINSIFGTLFLTIIAMWTWDSLKHPKQEPKRFAWGVLGLIFLVFGPVLSLSLMNVAAASGNTVMIVLSTSVIPTALTVEGGIGWILLGLVFHIFRDKRWIGLTIFVIFSLFLLWQSAMHGFSDYQWMMIFATPLLALYNGKQGRKDKWFFYIFYPTHIAVLYIISTVFFAH